MTVVPLSDTTWLLDNGAIVSDDGTTVTVTFGGKTITIPPKQIPRVRAIIGTAPPVVQPDIDESMHGVEKWTPHREGM
jgi:hypothetical protein